MKLTVATFNILHGAAAAFDWESVAAPLRSCEADIVGLQEVDQYTHRSHGANTVEALAHATGLEYAVFTPSMSYDGGAYGTAILSRYPIHDFSVYPLQADNLEPRACGICTLSLEDGRRIRMANTHLSYENRDIRARQFAELAALLATPPAAQEARLLTADFNTEALSEFTPLTGDGTLSAVNVPPFYKTFRNPPMAIDNILYDTCQMQLLQCGMVETTMSDHNLLWARFAL